jgi:hypothetical protein
MRIACNMQGKEGGKKDEYKLLVRMSEGGRTLERPKYRWKDNFEMDREQIEQKKTPWPESANELYRPSDRPLSAKLVPNFADRGCHL